MTQENKEDKKRASPCCGAEYQVTRLEPMIREWFSLIQNHKKNENEFVIDVIHRIAILLTEKEKTARDEGFECGCQNANRMAKEAYERGFAKGKINLIASIVGTQRKRREIKIKTDFLKSILPKTEHINQDNYVAELLSNAKNQGIIIEE